MKPFMTEMTATPRSDREFLDAWQYIHDTGLSQRLKDTWVEDRISDMIREGILEP